MQRYNPKEIEPKWQKAWEDSGVYHATEDPSKPKKFILEFFPYPSGAAMHVGHVRNYTIGDATARFWRMNGHNVLHPMGWDAFGLPAENYAIKTGISPQQAVAQNVEHFKKQLIQMGFGYDWEREINSTDPGYYKWTQWFFNLLFKRGLAYQSESMQWWCESCKTVLANEQVVNGKCWRHDGSDDPMVQKRPLRQWFFKITDYADRLLSDLDGLDWSESIKSMQRNWIGKSYGVIYKNKVRDTDLTIESFSAHYEAFTANSFVAIAPDHPFLPTLVAGLDNAEEILAKARDLAARRDALGETGVEMMEGIDTGRAAIDFFGDEDLPIWITSYALADYGTGIVLCSAHDERDFAFAKKYGLRLKPTMFPADAAEAEKVRNLEYPFTDMNHGILAESDKFTGKVAAPHREAIADYMEEIGYAEKSVKYKIRDWLISRQRYWGAPIPIVWISSTIDTFSGAVAEALPKTAIVKSIGEQELQAIPVPVGQLPVELPEVEDYQPDGTGVGPLGRSEDWFHVWFNTDSGATVAFSAGKPNGGEWVEGWRETDTMDGFACSSWYPLRYADPQNDQKPFDDDKVKFWLPVDTYIGGAEHAVMHLLYARMWTKVMYDEGLINFTEPFQALKNQGMILAPDGAKMSKSKGNTIAPGEIIDQGYGADAIRVMELFVGPWNQQANWSVEGMGGCYRFLNRVWTITQDYIAATATESGDETALLVAAHKATKRVTDDMHEFGFNTAIAALMELGNELYKAKEAHGIAKTEAWKYAVTTLVQLVAPFAPHISEELWSQLGYDGSVHTSQWPSWDEQYLVSATMTIAVQVNGKLRGTVEVPSDSTQEFIVAEAQKLPRVEEHIAGKALKKTIYIPQKLVSFVV
jgi:leucyl-tRNA synthetase